MSPLNLFNPEKIRDMDGLIMMMILMAIFTVLCTSGIK